MEESVLKKALAKLPVIKIFSIPEDNQLIEGDEDGCHYIITKVSQYGKFILYYLSVSGPPENRQRVISCFIEILGPPYNGPVEELPGIYFLCWWARNVDLLLASNKEK